MRCAFLSFIVGLRVHTLLAPGTLPPRALAPRLGCMLSVSGQKCLCACGRDGLLMAKPIMAQVAVMFSLSAQADWACLCPHTSACPSVVSVIVGLAFVRMWKLGAWSVFFLDPLRVIRENKTMIR